eukprot:1098546-Ditylum_brightwellii.AAC.1
MGSSTTDNADDGNNMGDDVGHGTDSGSNMEDDAGHGAEDEVSMGDGAGDDEEETTVEVSNDAQDNSTGDGKQWEQFTQTRSGRV